MIKEEDMKSYTVKLIVTGIIAKDKEEARKEFLKIADNRNYSVRPKVTENKFEY